MNKKVLYIIGIVVIILIILGLLVMKNKKAEAPTDELATIESNETTTIDATGGSQSLRDLVMSGQSVSCTFSHNDGQQTVGGTVRVSGGKVRGDFDMMAGTQKAEGHMIMDGGMTYVWSSLMPQGVKFTMSAQATSSPVQSGQAIDYNTAMDYHCEPWTTDASAYVVPANMTFMDMSAMMKTGTPTP